MTIHIALLRGINVGGRKMVAMSELRDVATRLGLEEPRTLLQSGNLVVRSGKKPAEIEKLLEREFDAKVFVRTGEEWQEIVAQNPFAKEAKSDPSHLLLMSFREKVIAFDWPGPEQIRADGRHLYISYPAGIGTSKLTNTVIERKLGTLGTARNWNTVLKIAALCVS